MEDYVDTLRDILARLRALSITARVGLGSLGTLLPDWVQTSDEAWSAVSVCLDADLLTHAMGFAQAAIDLDFLPDLDLNDLITLYRERAIGPRTVESLASIDRAALIAACVERGWLPDWEDER